METQNTQVANNNNSGEGVTETQKGIKFRDFKVEVVLNLGYSTDEKDKIENLVRMALSKEMPSEQIGKVFVTERNEEGAN